MSSNVETNVRIRLVNAWQDYLRQNNQDYLRQNNPEPSQVRFSWFTACDFIKISPELGELGHLLLRKGPDVLNGEFILNLRVTIDKKLPENAVPEFYFS
jgi:hypothetical protein